MPKSSRRQFLAALAGSTATGLAGCVAGPAGEPPSATTTPSSPTGGNTGWERSTDCEHTPTGMYDSVIRIEAVRETLPDGYAPIAYTALTAPERAIIDQVLEQGGYGTCNVSDAFNRFLERVGTAREQQTDAVEEDLHIYLAYEGRYYRLYVEKTDQVYAY